MSKPVKKIITTVYLPESLILKLKVFAAKKNRSMSDVMEKAVIKYMAEKPMKPKTE